MKPYFKRKEKWHKKYLQKTATTPMEIKVEEVSPQMSVIIPQGEIDMGSSGELRDVLQLATKNRIEVIIVSLQDAGHIDSSGIATLIETLKKMEKYKGQLRLVISTKKILNVFKIANLNMVFKVYESIKDAKNA
ncbi:STAS domain-containing protein [Candidatus Uabimicrobium sp. HlEnr_7]|uniref:STAS domain-containing protein n=1 Tax=Candidatus Uabimicrobium helgolandensis TaxID=3095367 RepID=UPI003557F235